MRNFSCIKKIWIFNAVIWSLIAFRWIFLGTTTKWVEVTPGQYLGQVVDSTLKLILVEEWISSNDLCVSEVGALQIYNWVKLEKQVSSGDWRAKNSLIMSHVWSMHTLRPRDDGYTVGDTVQGKIQKFVVEKLHETTKNISLAFNNGREVEYEVHLLGEDGSVKVETVAIKQFAPIATPRYKAWARLLRHVAKTFLRRAF